MNCKNICWVCHLNKVLLKSDENLDIFTLYTTSEGHVNHLQNVLFYCQLGSHVSIMYQHNVSEISLSVIVIQPINF